MALNRQIPPIRVETRTLAELHRIAKAQDTTVSTLIRRMLEDAIARAKQPETP